MENLNRNKNKFKFIEFSVILSIQFIQILKISLDSFYP